MKIEHKLQESRSGLSGYLLGPDWFVKVIIKNFNLPFLNELLSTFSWEKLVYYNQYMKLVSYSKNHRVFYKNDIEIKLLSALIPSESLGVNKTYNTKNETNDYTVTFSRLGMQII